MKTDCLLDGDSESKGFALARVSVATGSASLLATSGSERTPEIVSGKAVPLRKNSIRVLSIKASPTLLCTRGAEAFFIEDDDG